MVGAGAGNRCTLTITAGTGFAGHPLMFAVSTAADGCTVTEDTDVSDGVVPPGGGVTGGGGTTGTTGGGGTTGATGGGGSGVNAKASGGCSCDVGAGAGPTWLALFVFVGLAIWATARRRTVARAARPRARTKRR